MTHSIKLSACLFFGLIVWMLSASLLKSTPKTAAQTAIITPQKMRVVIKESKAQWIEPTIIASGQTAPNKESTLKAEIIGVVASINKHKGEVLKQGDTIVKLKVSDKLARLEEAEAGVYDEETTLKAMQHLKPQGYSEETKFNDTKTALAKAKAQLLAINIELSKTNITAPFDGILSELNVEEGDYLKAGDPIGAIVNNSPLMVEVGIAEKDINQVTLGAKALVHLITGEQLTGKVRFISPKANVATRMFTVEIELPNPNNLRAGLSSEAIIFAPAVLTHFISPALLSMDQQGTLGIKTIDENNIVHFQPINIIRANNAGLWVSGLPTTATLVSIGQGFVNEGEIIIPVNEDTGKGAL